MMDRESLAEWAKDKPLSILQLDPADRAVLRIAGKLLELVFYLLKKVGIDLGIDRTVKSKSIVQFC